MNDASLLSIQVGLPRDIGTDDAADPMDQLWHSGFYKKPIAGPVQVGHLTVTGDGQADLSVHGGPDRPILAYAAAHYAEWERELGITLVPFGAFGENFTVQGLTDAEVCLGDRYAIGSLLVEVSQPRQPCWKLARRWRNKALPALVIKHFRGGWYFRVLKEGIVEAGNSIQLIERPYPKWTIAAAMNVMYHGQGDMDATRELATLPPLSADWRAYFSRRLDAASAS
jgi:MOSC domain-containing protein YiiM